MSKSFEGLANKLQESWSDDAWKVYEAAGVSFENDLDALDTLKEDN